jgi:hypothetical protein
MKINKVINNNSWLFMYRIILDVVHPNVRVKVSEIRTELAETFHPIVIAITPWIKK